jgi:hypothetical protein
MQYYARVGIGGLLGLLGAIGLAFLVDATWPAALAGALLAAIGFLATFFLWTADRPPSPQEPQGYEQVLFDPRNLVHLAALALLVAGGAYGWSLMFDGPG